MPVSAFVEDGSATVSATWVQSAALKISPATVKNHVHMILDKLNLPRRRLIAVDRQIEPPKL